MRPRRLGAGPAGVPLHARGGAGATHARRRRMSPVTVERLDYSKRPVTVERLDYSKRVREVGQCYLCGQPLIAEDGVTPNEKHLNCIMAARRAGQRLGYADAVRMLKAATKAIKTGGAA